MVSFKTISLVKVHAVFQFCTIISFVNCESSNVSLHVSIPPIDNLLLNENVVNLNILINLFEKHEGKSEILTVDYISSDLEIFNVVGESSVNVNGSQNSSFSLFPKQLGRAVLTVNVSNLEHKFISFVNVTVIHERTALGNAFIAVIVILVGVLTFGFGCKIHVDIVKQILKKPVSPAIGLFCQIFLMPLVSS